MNARQRAWTRQATRSVDVPAKLAPPDDCYLADPGRSAACLAPLRVPPTSEIATPVGTYQPLPYLLAAPAARLGGGPQPALRWARLPGAALSLLLLGIALAVLRDPRSLLGLVVATTPMVLFCAASLTGSGPEIAAGIAFAAVLLRLCRPEPPPRAVWAAAALAGAVLALSRSPGPAWVVLLLLLPIALVGPRSAWARLRAGGAAAGVAAAVVVGAVLLNRAWEAAYGPSLGLVTDTLGYGTRRAIDQWWTAAPELVGRFGYLEFDLPLWIPLAWLALLVLLLVTAWGTADRRQRRVLLGMVAFALIFPIALYLVVIRPIGFGLQGRHVLPVLAALPLLAGELIRRRDRTTAIVVGCTAGVLQVAAFWWNARRAAVGTDGPLWFLGHAEWSPPGGWGPALALAIAGGACLAAFGLRHEPSPGDDPR